MLAGGVDTVRGPKAHPVPSCALCPLPHQSASLLETLPMWGGSPFLWLRFLNPNPLEGPGRTVTHGACLQAAPPFFLACEKGATGHRLRAWVVRGVFEGGVPQAKVEDTGGRQAGLQKTREPVEHPPLPDLGPPRCPQCPKACCVVSPSGPLHRPYNPPETS